MEGAGGRSQCQGVSVSASVSVFVSVSVSLSVSSVCIRINVPICIRLRLRLRLSLRLSFRDCGGGGSERYLNSRRVLYEHANACFTLVENVIVNKAVGLYTNH